MLKRTCTLSAAVVILTAIISFFTGVALAHGQDSTTVGHGLAMVTVAGTFSSYDSTEFESEQAERSGFWRWLTWRHDRRYHQKAKGPLGILDPNGPAAPYGRLVYDIHGYPYRTFPGGYRRIPVAIPPTPVLPGVYQGVPPEYLATVGLFTRQQPNFPNVIIRDFGEIRDGPIVNEFSVRVEGCSAALGTGTVIYVPGDRWYSFDGGQRVYVGRYGPGVEFPGRIGARVDQTYEIWHLDTPACPAAQTSVPRYYGQY
ncbi:MAG: hypothetical protein HY420_04775 [Candidatus Kerfeldbacteria bacterium]|nr:hypothetical protein [Candidatus Kerfeldbacteria bacterium]